MKRVSPSAARQLDPDLEDAVNERFVWARRRRRWFDIFRKRSKAASVAAILERHLPRHAVVLETQIRHIADTALSSVHIHAWNWLRRIEATAADVIRDDPEAALVLMTAWSGYVREAAVRAIKAPLGPFGLSLLVLRTNDWVGPVRKAATSKLRALSATIEDSVIVESAPLLWQFERVGRAEPAARTLIHDELLQRPGVVAALQRIALSGASDNALHAFLHLLRTPALDGDLASIATSNPHPAIRTAAASAALTGVVRWREPYGPQHRERVLASHTDRDALAHTLMHDRAGGVRRAALRYIVERPDLSPEDTQLLLDAALDRRQTLADIARWRLARSSVDWLEQARDTLRRDGPTPAIAEALARHGSEADGEALWRASEGLPTPQALPALIAAARLKSSAAAERLRDIALRDDDLLQARRAARGLADAGVIISAEELTPLADRGDVLFARGLRPHLLMQSAAAFLILIARLEAAGATLDMHYWFAKALHKINRGAFAPSPEEERILAHVLNHAPIARERARGLRIGA